MILWWIPHRYCRRRQIYIVAWSCKKLTLPSLSQPGTGVNFANFSCDSKILNRFTQERNKIRCSEQVFEGRVIPCKDKRVCVKIRAGFYSEMLHCVLFQFWYTCFYEWTARAILENLYSIFCSCIILGDFSSFCLIRSLYFALHSVWVCGSVRFPLSVGNVFAAKLSAVKLRSKYVYSCYCVIGTG